MTASEYIKELSRFFDYQEYDKIRFYANLKNRTLVPYLVDESSVIPNEAWRIISDYFGLKDEHIEDYPRLKKHTTNVGSLRGHVPPLELWLYHWLVNVEFAQENKHAWKVVVVSENVYVHFFVPLVGVGEDAYSTREVLDNVLKRYCFAITDTWSFIHYSPTFVKENKLGSFSYKALFDLCNEYYENPLVFVCLHDLIGKSQSFIRKFLGALMETYSRSKSIRQPYFTHNSVLRISKSIYDYEWKAHVRAHFESAKYLFVNDEQMEVWEAVMSFCKCDKIEPAGTAKPFFSKHWGDAALDRLWIYLKDSDQISRTTTFDMMRYYFGGGRGIMPEGKIQWIGTNNNIIHALIDTFDAGTHGKWERATGIFDVNPPIELSSKRATSVRRDNNKEYNDGPKKLTPYKNYLEIFKKLKKNPI